MKKETPPIGKQGRRSYDDEFKASTLRLIAGGRSVADVARSLGINENLVYKWKSAAEANEATSGSDEEKESMRRYIKQLEMEREILKKALSIFSRTT